MELLLSLPWTITACWLLLIAWSVAQFLWYEQLRSVPVPVSSQRAVSGPSRTTRRAAAPTMLSVTKIPEFIAEPETDVLQNTDDNKAGSSYVGM